VTDERRNSPYLRPVSTPREQEPLSAEDFKAPIWQRTLFVSGNEAMMGFALLSELSEADFTLLISEANSRFVIDLRPVPRFDIGTLTRRAVFSLFAQARTKYLDLSGHLEVLDRRDSKLNPRILSGHVRTLLAPTNGVVAGPLIFLVESFQFTNEYVTTLSDELQSLRPGGWEVARIPAAPRPPRNHGVSDGSKRAIFISHANPEDNEFVRWLGSKLVLAGYQVWSDVSNLVGGETFWDTIEQAIRVDTCKVLAVLSTVAQTKNGFLDEINLAISVERAAGRDDFVLPIRLDSLSFDQVRANLARKNIVDFSKNWASGLTQLFMVLERDRVPKVKEGADHLLGQWMKMSAPMDHALVRSPEILSSNWLAIESLPEEIEFLPTLGGNLEREPRTRTGFEIGESFVTFRKEPQAIPEGAKSAVVRTADMLASGVTAPTNLSPRDASNVITNLVRQAWDQYVQRKGLLKYELSAGNAAWYLPTGLIDNDCAFFFDGQGKKRRKYLVGRSDKRGVFWHFALEARPMLARRNRFSLISHVVFTHDGGAELVSADRMHSLRRQFCKNWWNDRWRDLTIAYASWIFDGRASIGIPDAVDGPVRIVGRPMSFRSPVRIMESAEDKKFDRLLEETEWQDLDVLDADEDVGGRSIDSSDEFE
jgi:hypothetical protein